MAGSPENGGTGGSMKWAPNTPRAPAAPDSKGNMTRPERILTAENTGSNSQSNKLATSTNSSGRITQMEWESRPETESQSASAETVAVLWLIKSSPTGRLMVSGEAAAVIRPERKKR